MRSLNWIAEVRHFRPTVPVILVGCKSDLRDDQRVIIELSRTANCPVSPEEVRSSFSRVHDSSFSTHVPKARAAAQGIGAEQYVECSARSGENVHRLFELAAWIAIDGSKSTRGRHARGTKHICVIL